MKTLNEIRKKIDQLDDKIIALLKKRIHLAIQTKKHKKNISDKKREDEILNKIDTANIKKIYQKIISICKKAQS